MLRSSPESPISAAKQTPFGIGVSILLDKIAATTERSIAGSSILIPPVTFKKTSLEPSLKPAFFSITAKIILSLFALYPVVLRCGVPYTALLTRA